MNLKRVGEDNMDDSTKRQKVGPSKVIHCRGLPTFTAESELTLLTQPFGRVVRTLILNDNQQAFIQFESLENAMAFVSHYDTTQAQIRNKNCYFQFSNRTEVQKSSPQAGGGGGGNNGATGQVGAGDPPNHILLVSVLNARVPVTMDNIYQVFQPLGTVQKIITFMKNGVFKALVQMATLDQAINAKYLLEDKDMFEGCCHLRIGFSTLSDLTVKNNGPTSRDYTVSDPLSGGQFGGQFSQFGQFGNLAGQYGSSQSQFSNMPAQGGLPGQYGNFMQPQQEQKCVLLVNNLPEQLTSDNLFMLFGCYGDVVRVKILYNKRDSAMIEFVNGEHASTALVHLNHFVISGQELAIATSKHNSVSPPRDGDSELLTKDYTNSPIHRFRKPGSRKNINPPSSVLHISNLHDEASVQELSQLFSSVGSPEVQFFATNRKMAYVKMESAEQAATALMHFHNQQLQGRYLRLSFSNKDPNSIKPDAL